jgi:hypothetical protein
MRNRMGGETCQGRCVPGGGQGPGHNGRFAVPQGRHGAGTAIAPSQVRLAGPATGRMT